MTIEKLPQETEAKCSHTGKHYSHFASSYYVVRQRRPRSGHTALQRMRPCIESRRCPQTQPSVVISVHTVAVSIYQFLSRSKTRLFSQPSRRLQRMTSCIFSY